MKLALEVIVVVGLLALGIYAMAVSPLIRDCGPLWGGQRIAFGLWINGYCKDGDVRWPPT